MLFQTERVFLSWAWPSESVLVLAKAPLPVPDWDAMMNKALWKILPESSTKWEISVSPYFREISVPCDRICYPHGFHKYTQIVHKKTLLAINLLIINNICTFWSKNPENIDVWLKLLSEIFVLTIV